MSVTARDMEIEMLARLHLAGPSWREWSGGEISHFMARVAAEVIEREAQNMPRFGGLGNPLAACGRGVCAMGEGHDGRCRV